MMNPLSSWTYHRRHTKRTGLLFALISLVTLGLYLIVTLALITTLGPIQPEQHYVQKVSRVHPRPDSTLMAQVRAHPSVDRVIPEIGLPITINTLSGNDTFYLMGVKEEDIAALLAQTGVTVSDGRLLQPRASELMLSAELAANLGLQLGDSIGRAINQDSYSAIREPMTLVGLLSGETRLGIVSYEFLDSHELYRRQASNGILVMPKPGQAEVLDLFLTNTFQRQGDQVMTLSRLLADRSEVIRSVSWIFGPIAALITVVLTLVSAVINQIELTRRLPELGIFSVIGYGKGWLTRRLTGEITLVALVGWAVGVIIPCLLLALVERFYLGPRGYPFHAFQPTAFLFTVPIPLGVVLAAFWSIARTFARLDGIAIIERGELAMEQRPTLPQAAPPSAGAPSAHTAAQRYVPQPLTSLTYYQRHRWRAAMLIGTMMLMIMAVVLLVLSASTSTDATVVAMGDLQRMSIVRSLNQLTLDAGVMARIRTHATVARVIPAAEIVPLSIDIPPFSNAGLSAYAVGEEDLAQVVQLYGLQIKEGRLPRPRSNEVIIPESAALNRQLKVGDLLGGETPAYPDAFDLPAPLVISGIFARAESRQDENWLAFASLEFISSHEEYAGLSTFLLVIPKPGQKEMMDRWLTSEVVSNQVDVSTYEQSLADFQDMWRNILTVISVVEGVITLVAAIALAVLNYIFIGQRQVEFGVLNALGYGRRWLAWRTLRESFLTTATAWGLSVLLCAIVLLYLQYFVFQPLGLVLDFFNPTPWYFTLPVPIVVLLVSVGTTNQLLRRIDPVTVIEKA